MSDMNLKELARAIANEMKKTEHLLAPSDVALMCGYEPYSTAARKVLADPTFPAPVSLIDEGRPRYRRKDVLAWIDAKFEKESNLALSTHRASWQ